tara:strand:- start:267 stop:830 length:564 start_codon:yes stop_codon:yes gene_type:complete
MTTLNSATKNTDNYDLVPKDHKVMVSYRGTFKSVTSEYLLNWIERFYARQELHPSIKLKGLFRVSVELIQNLIHHSKNSDSFFFVSKSDNGDMCVLGTSNPVSNDQATILSSTLTTLKNTTQSELRGLKMNVLEEGKRSSHGGGGMGLLDLTKISSGNINYEFLPWSQDKLLFCLTIHLHSTPDSHG